MYYHYEKWEYMSFVQRLSSFQRVQGQIQNSHKGVPFINFPWNMPTFNQATPIFLLFNEQKGVLLSPKNPLALWIRHWGPLLDNIRGCIKHSGCLGTMFIWGKGRVSNLHVMSVSAYDPTTCKQSCMHTFICIHTFNSLGLVWVKVRHSLTYGNPPCPMVFPSCRLQEFIRRISGTSRQ